MCRTKNARLKACFWLLLGLTPLSSCSENQPAQETVARHDPSQAYLDLLAKFPATDQGLSKEPTFQDIAEQPLTYALLLTAESLRYLASPTDEGRQRIRNATNWLVANRDLDQDGKPGWGLPDAWDAFGDGTVNPPNQPYTFTTAMVLLALMNAESLPNFWRDAERAELLFVMRGVALRWVQEAYTESPTGSFFWYSTNINDAKFVTNDSAIISGALARLLGRHSSLFTASETQLIGERIDAAVELVNDTAELRNGSPFWNYWPRNSIFDPNDTAHHGYTLLGMELYRDFRNRIPLRWSRAQSVQSLDTFIRNGKLYAYPQDVTYTGQQAFRSTEPTRLWGAGTQLYLYGLWSDSAHTQMVYSAIQKDYGPIPDLILYPPNFSPDKNFYARYAVHVLWGLAARDFVQVDLAVATPWSAGRVRALFPRIPS